MDDFYYFSVDLFLVFIIHKIMRTFFTNYLAVRV